MVTRGGTREIAVLAAMAIVALLLAACGSSGSSDSSSTGAQTSARDNGSAGGTEGENDAGESRPDEQEPRPDSLSAVEVETPLKVSGGGSDQFRSKGGDNSIQEFGDEGDESELQEAAETVHSFFVARATGDWARACSYLSKQLQEQLEQLAESSTTLENKGCPSFLQAFTGHLSAKEWRAITTIDAGSLRLDGEQGFLIYFGTGHAAFAMPLEQEDGGFKVGALAGDALG
jgi:hypothetical protein